MLGIARGFTAGAGAAAVSATRSGRMTRDFMVVAANYAGWMYENEDGEVKVGHSAHVSSAIGILSFLYTTININSIS